MSRRQSTNRPIIVVVGFNMLTLAVFLTAPVRWDTDNLLQLCLLVLCCQLSILIGFQLGRKGGLSRRPRVKLLRSGDRVMNYLVGFYVFTFLFSYAYRMGFSPLDVTGMSNLLLAGLSDRHFGYEMALRGTGLGPVPWTVYFSVSILDQSFFIAGFILWKRMPAIAKGLFGFFVVAELLFSVGRGTSFGVVSMVTTFFLSSMFWTKQSKSGVGSVLRNVLLASLLFGGSIALFSYDLYSRSGNVERGLDVSEFRNSSIIVDNSTLSIVPEPLRPTYLNVVSYFGGGYYHASLALDLDFRSTWFLGNNPALIGLASLVGFDVWRNTYMHRLQAAKGVDEYGNWHSAYTWYACDVSFYGVPVILFCLGYMFGFSWAMSLHGDFLSRIVFIILGNMLLFLFANNTYLSTVFYSFMFVLPLWMATRLIDFAPFAAVEGSRTPSGHVSTSPGELSS